MCFSRNRHFHPTKKRYDEQARKAVHIYFLIIRNLYIPICLLLYLFDNVILPVALYGCEIWGFKNSQSKLFKINIMIFSDRLLV